MKDIKTRETVHDVRALDRALNVTDRMKNTYIRTKEQAEQSQQTNTDSPAGYAEDLTTENAQDMTRETGYILRHKGKRLLEKVRKQKSDASNASTSTKKPYTSYRNPPNYITRAHDFVRYNAQRRTERPVSDIGRKEAKQGTKITIKTSAKGSVKAVKRGVKTAEKTSRTAIKTIQTTAKTTAKTAQVTAKTAQWAAQAAKAATKLAVTAAKAIAKAIAATTRAIVAAFKGLIAAIAAGGGVAVAVIIVILVAAAVLGSVFGIFASEKGYNGEPSMPEVVSQINAAFSAKINSIIEDNPHDKLVIDNAGSASMVANWNEVLAIYDVLVATDPGYPMEVATLNDAKIDKLNAVFWDMNHISYSLKELEVDTDKETGEPITEIILTISINYMAAEDMISFYGFSAERAEKVKELLRSEYAELFQRLAGSYVDVTLSEAEIAAVMETLPANLNEARKDVVLTAYSLLGRVKYFWGGKSLVLGWDSSWGMPMEVTADDSPTTGTVRPFGLDCSGFVDWVFFNASGGEYIIGHGGGALAQYSYCDAIPWIDAQPGDLSFYPSCEHVGIVVNNDAGTLTVIHCASGSNNVVMTQHTQGSGFAYVGRPQIYNK